MRESACSSLRDLGLFSVLLRISYATSGKSFPFGISAVVTVHFCPVGTEARNYSPHSLSLLPDFMQEVQWE